MFFRSHVTFGWARRDSEDFKSKLQLHWDEYMMFADRIVTNSKGQRVIVRREALKKKYEDEEEKGKGK